MRRGKEISAAKGEADDKESNLETAEAGDDAEVEKMNGETEEEAEQNEEAENEAASAAAEFAFDAASASKQV